MLMMFSSILNTQNTANFRCKNSGLRLGRELSRKHGLLPLSDRYDSASHFCSVREHLAGTCPYRPVVPSGESKRYGGHCHPRVPLIVCPTYACVFCHDGLLI